MVKNENEICLLKKKCAQNTVVETAAPVIRTLLRQ
jgi:hypothetical protein